jgi:hypothetical protein
MSLPGNQCGLMLRPGCTRTTEPSPLKICELGWEVIGPPIVNVVPAAGASIPPALNESATVAGMVIVLATAQTPFGTSMVVSPALVAKA